MNRSRSEERPADPLEEAARVAERGQAALRQAYTALRAAAHRRRERLERKSRGAREGAP